jgi:hypothetical protein
MWQYIGMLVHAKFGVAQKNVSVQVCTLNFGAAQKNVSVQVCVINFGDARKNVVVQDRTINLSLRIVHTHNNEVHGVRSVGRE